jgi:hypothetical protein
MSTGEAATSTKGDTASTVRSALSIAMVVLAATAVFLSVTLTIRTFMPCPLLDEWRVLADIVGGTKPWSFQWLWGQHSEHRIAITRLLVWLDWVAFGGKNISLFVEIYLIQIAHFVAICYAVERSSAFPKSLKRMLEGVFAFCLFHPSQAQNLTWAFQVSFVLPFAIGTIALLGVAFLEKSQTRWRFSILVGAGAAPIFAGLTLASGLLIGPAVLALAYAKRIGRSAVLALAACSLLSISLYFYGYRTPPGHSSPLRAVLHPWEILRYVLVLLDTSWHFFSIASISLICFAACVIAATRSHQRVSNFEWFCIAECGLILTTASLIACGRIQYGVAQAAESRYQTPAMIYWACLFSLVLIAVWRWRPSQLTLLQMAIGLIALSSLLFLAPFWSRVLAQSDSNRVACASVVLGDDRAARRLDFLADDPRETSRVAALLRERWTPALSGPSPHQK